LTSQSFEAKMEKIRWH